MPASLLQFDDFVLDRDGYELRRRGVPVSLQRIPFELLCLLVERPGQVVTRDEIVERLWGKGVFVDSENGINTAVRKLRQALCDNPEAPRFVATVPRKGYRFVAQIGGSNRVRAEQFRVWPTAMVGRERELASLIGGLDEAAAGNGQLFLISGEPGVGKTRLTDELARVAQEKGMTLLVGHCSEQDGSFAYLPFVEILEDCADRASNVDALRRALGDQGRELARLLPKLKTLLPEIAPPLDLPPAQARRHLFNSFCEFVARVSRDKPTMMILDDLHWADDSTLSLLDHLAQRLSAFPILVVATHRDAESDIGAGLARVLEGLLRRRLASRLKLENLERNEVRSMLANLSGKSPPDSVVGKIHDETDGNPFFVEELFRHLEEENRLYDSTGQFRTNLKIGELEAPQSVRLIVARRLARLDGSTQKMLSMAAVIGHFFNFELLKAASEASDDSLTECLEQAERAEFIFSVVENSKLRFQFSHELVRQAVLAGLYTLRCEMLHLKIADAIERLYPALNVTRAGKLDSHFSELAYHYAHASHPAKAVKYCLLAVRHFNFLGSSTEAVTQYENGLQLLRQLPDDAARAELELDLRNAAFGALGDSRGYTSLEAEHSYSRAIEICRQPGINWEKAWVALYSNFFVHQLRPDVLKAEAIAAELIARAEEHRDVVYLAEAENWFAYAKMISGDLELASEILDRSWSRLTSIPEPIAVRNQGSDGQTRPAPDWSMGTRENNRALSGWALWMMGYPDRALDRANLATEIAQSGPKTILVDIHGFASYIHELRREPELMRARAEARSRLSAKSGYFTGRALSAIYLGWSDALAGDLEGGIARMQHQMSELKAAGSEYISDRCNAFIATALGRLRRFDDALGTIDEALQFTERTRQRYFEAELHRLRGELLLAKDKSTAARAEQSLRTAIEISRSQRAKSFELRATTSLARLLAKQRKHDKARSMLGDVYGWFTEGFETSDLKEAKLLLDELDKIPEALRIASKRVDLAGRS